MFGKIMELFGQGNSGQQQPAVDPARQQQINNNTTVPGQTTPTSDGSVKAIPAAGTGEKSPLEKYQDLWKAPDKQEGSDNGTANLVPQFNIDPSKLAEAATKIDFLSGVPAEKLAEAMTNPEVFKEILNNGLRNAFINSATTSGSLIQSSLGNAEEVLRNKILPESYKSQAVRASLAENPVFQSSAVAPVVAMVQQQLQLKHPTASAKEIADMAIEYVQGVSNAVVTGSGGQITRNQGNSGSRSGMISKRAETDWTEWLAADNGNR